MQINDASLANNNLAFLQSIVSAFIEPTVLINGEGLMCCVNPALREFIKGGQEIIGLKLSALGIVDIITVKQNIEKAKIGISNEQDLSCTFGGDVAFSFRLSWTALTPVAGLGQLFIGVFRKCESPNNVATSPLEINNEHPSAAELEAILHSISDGIYVGNIDGVQIANKSALDMLGFTDLHQLNDNLASLSEKLDSKDAVTGLPILPEEIPFVRALGGETVTKDVLIRHQLTGGQRTMRCAASPVLRNGKIIAAVAINTDVTNQHLIEENLRQSEERQAFLLKFSDAIRTISDPIAIQEIATRMLGEHLSTDRAFYARMDEKAKQSFVEREFVRYQSISLIGHHQYADFGIAVTTMSAGHPFIADDVATVSELDPQRENYQAMDFNSLMATPLIKDGEMVACMCVTQFEPRHWTHEELLLLQEVAERTWAAVQRAYSEAALQQRETELRTFVAASSDMVYRMSADWKQLQQISSENFEPELGQDNSNWMQEYVPKKEQPRLIATIETAIKTKSLFEIEHEIIEPDGAVGWRHCRAIPILNKDGKIREWLATASNITQRKLAQQQLQQLTLKLEQLVGKRTAQLKESRDQLQLILDTTLTQISILQAVRDKKGEISDLQIKFVNRELEKETGRTDLVGKLYAEQYPSIHETGLFAMIVKTIETGQPQQTEYYYPHDGFNKWYTCMFVKLGDGVVASNMDITSSKIAQEERFKNYLLLQQSEELATLGNWDYHLSSKVFSWSDGMYRLFDLEKGTEVSPEIYLDFTTADGKPAAERVVNHIKSGDCGFDETLELKIDGKIKILHLKATVVNNKQGNAVRVLGVDMDVTAARAAEETIRSMEAQQQQEIFRVTLSSQEEERRRISESLHNGLAQTLYGVKISTAQLTKELAAKDNREFNQTKRYTEQLLIDAIAESRRISHELMPTILDDFGLRAAIVDICKQLSNQIKFHCTFSGLKVRPDRLMELAVFRTVQELAVNVVKHASATKAYIKVNFKPTEIFIQVGDNGKGMLAKQVTGGIGLASIRSKVKLLNGKMKIDSSIGNGTTVTVQIPNLPSETSPTL